MTDDPRAARKLAAKRANERIKLLASLLNSLALGVIGAGVIVPVTQNPGGLPWQSLAWFVFGLALHSVAQAVFAFMRDED